MSVIEKIKQCIRERNYLISSHAEEEMAEDGFDMKCEFCSGNTKHTKEVIAKLP